VVVYLYQDKDIYTHKGLYHNKDIFTHNVLYNYNDSVSLIILGNRIYTIRVCTQGMEPDSLIFTREQKGSGVGGNPIICIFIYKPDYRLYLCISVNELSTILTK
jgi:hypothetical protein